MSLIFIAVICGGLLVACGSGPPIKARLAETAELARPGAEKVKYTRGNKSPYVVFGETYEVLPSNVGYREIGIASWYGQKFHGRLTSNGEVYDMYQLTAAHKALPLPTVVKVTNLDNGQSVIVRVNDRGPFHSDRLIDLSYATARFLGFANQGTAPVVVEALDAHNHPQLVCPVQDGTSDYLQAGAFSKSSGAETLLAKIKHLLAQQNITDIEVHILQSEMETSLLHKVWLGPIENQQKRKFITMLVSRAKLGTVINVEVK